MANWDVTDSETKPVRKTSKAAQLALSAHERAMFERWQQKNTLETAQFRTANDAPDHHLRDDFYANTH